MNGHIDDRRVITFVEIYPLYLCRCGHAVLEQDATPHIGGRPFRHFSTDNGAIGLWDLMTGMREMLGKIAVIGQQEQTRRVSVEPSNRIDSPLDTLDQIHHGVLSMGIADRRNIAYRLV